MESGSEVGLFMTPREKLEEQDGACGLYRSHMGLLRQQDALYRESCCRNRFRQEIAVEAGPVSLEQIRSVHLERLSQLIASARPHPYNDHL